MVGGKRVLMNESTLRPTQRKYMTTTKSVFFLGAAGWGRIPVNG